MLKRIAIIGLGQVTRNIHLPGYAFLKDKIEVVGGCELDDNVRQSVAQKWNIPETFTNPEEMIEKTQPDIVAICTPPSLHLTQTLLALEKGCHVFCEKPLAENLSDIDQIIQASEKANRHVVVNSQFPNMNIHTEAKKMIGTPQFGKLLFLHASQTFRPNNLTEADWRGQMKRRVCFEFGIHVFDLVRFFFDAEPIKVLAHMPKPDPKIKCDPIGFISLEFADGRAASILLDRLSKGPERYLDIRLDGEFGNINTSIGGEVRFEAGIHTREKKPFMNFNFVKGGKALFQDGNKSHVIAQDGINPFASATASHLGNFIDALIDKKEIIRGTAKDHKKAMALVFAAYDSAEAGKVIKINTTA